VGSVEKWKTEVKRVVGEEEGRKWRRRMAGLEKVGEAKVKLAMYVRVKTELRSEWFLDMDRVWVRRWVRMRAGVARLEEEMGRHRGVRSWNRVCRWCESGSVESVEHVLDECVKWKEERKEMWAEGVRLDVGKMRVVMGWSRRERVEWLLKGVEKKMRRGLMRKATRLYAREKEGEGKKKKKAKRKKRKKKQ
jgi:hypothetical protein